MWTVCLLLYTVAAQLFSVQGICLTGNATKDNAFLECQVFGDLSIESEIQLMDSDNQIRVKCTIYDSPYCVVREEGDLVFGEASNNGFKLVFQTTTKNVQGIWKCFHGRESANMHIDLSKGIVYSPEIHLSGEIKAHSKITLTCYSCTVPDTKSAYLFVNSVLDDVVRLHEGKCYRKSKQCSQTECTCSTEGNYFTWSFLSDSSYLEFSCEMRFRNKETSLLSIHTATLYYNDTEFQPKMKTIRNIPVSDKDIYDGGNDNDNSGIVVIITTVLLISIIAGTTFGCTIRNKFTGQELPMKGQTDATSLLKEVCSADGIAKIEAEKNVGQIEAEKNVGQIEAEKNVGQIEAEKIVGQIEAEKTVGLIETEKTFGQIETEKNVWQIETEKNAGQIITEKNVGQIETEKTVGQIETGKNVGHIEADKTVGLIETEKITLRKREKNLSFSQTLCDKCTEIPVCTVCINCRKLYCKSCSDVHTESGKDHTIFGVDRIKKNVGQIEIEMNVGQIKKEKNVGQIETQNNVGQIETQKNVGQIETQNNVGQIETQKNVGQNETQKNVWQIETEKNVWQIETENNGGQIIIEKNVGQIETEKNVGQIDTGKNVGQIEAEKTVGQIEAKKITPRKRKKNLSFSQTFCDKCTEIPVCTVCINCRKLYCKSCCDVHTESEKEHTIFHIPHVAAGNQEIKCGICKNKTAEQLCTICFNLMCESCAESHVHEGSEGFRMMIVYHGHPKLLRQTSEEKLNFFRDLSIEKRGERCPIRICGISYIADGRLILVDKRNRNLLVFQSKEETNRLHLEDEPHALTSMTGQRIAITFPFELEIRIYKISGNFIVKHHIICLPGLKQHNLKPHKPSFDREIHNLKPYSIAFDKDIFVVEVGEGDDGKILIMNDTQIHHVIRNKNFAYFTGNTIRLALEVNSQNPLEGRVFLSALSKNVVFCIDFKGKEIWKVSIPSPRGISIVPENCIPRSNLVICSRRCNTIFGLNKENGSDKQILLSEGKIKLPRYITCNHKDRLLCIHVGTEDDNEESVSCVEVRAPISN